MDNETILFDRIEIIKTANAKFDLEHNAYLSFSGGKDSTILHHLLDKALPDNSIPRVYVDTGIEYKAIREFVLDLASKDPRFVIIKPTKPIKKVLETYGYPFKSKEHSHFVAVYQHSGLGRSVNVYLDKEGYKMIKCPNALRYQFTDDFNIKVSDQCCLRLKKEPFKKYQKESGKTIVLTGMRKSEGGQRKSLTGCIITDKEGHLKKFHPLLVVDDDFENWFLERERITLCELYYPPFNFKRTGCKGCPFSLDLQEQLTLMELYLPAERKQCEIIWKPIYDEYRRIGYRLKQDEQLKLF